MAERRSSPTPALAPPTPRRAVVAVAIGLVIGLAVVAWAAAADRRDPLADDAFVIWAVLAVSLTVAAGVVFTIGLRAYAVTTEWLQVPVRTVWRQTMATVGVVGLALLAYLLRDVGDSSVRGVILCLTAAAGGAPVARTLFAVRSAVPARQSQGSLGDQVADYLNMRRLTAGLLPPLGSLVALATLALSAATTMADRASADGARADVVLVFGALATVAVAVPFNVARQPLRRWGEALVEALAPIEAGDPDVVIGQVERRTKVVAGMGTSQSLATEVQAGLWIAGPLLAGIAARYLG